MRRLEKLEYDSKDVYKPGSSTVRLPLTQVAGLGPVPTLGDLFFANTTLERASAFPAALNSGFRTWHRA